MEVCALSALCALWVLLRVKANCVRLLFAGGVACRPVFDALAIDAVITPGPHRIPPPKESVRPMAADHRVLLRILFKGAGRALRPELPGGSS